MTGCACRVAAQLDTRPVPSIYPGWKPERCSFAHPSSGKSHSWFPHHILKTCFGHGYLVVDCIVRILHHDCWFSLGSPLPNDAESSLHLLHALLWSLSTLKCLMTVNPKRRFIRHLTVFIFNLHGYLATTIWKVWLGDQFCLLRLGHAAGSTGRVIRHSLHISNYPWTYFLNENLAHTNTLGNLYICTKTFIFRIL